MTKTNVDTKPSFWVSYGSPLAGFGWDEKATTLADRLDAAEERRRERSQAIRQEAHDEFIEMWTMQRSAQLQARGIEPTAENMPVTLQELYADADREEVHIAAEARRVARKVLADAGLNSLEYVPYGMGEQFVPMTPDERGDAAIVTARQRTTKAGKRSWIQARWRAVTGHAAPESVLPWRPAASRSAVVTDEAVRSSVATDERVTAVVEQGFIVRGTNDPGRIL